jgi:hypothetical protein
MVVQEVDIPRIAIFEPEDNTPVRPNRDGPKAFEIALQCMQPEKRLPHIVWTAATSKADRMTPILYN